jgi:hypothetical protein
MISRPRPGSRFDKGKDHSAPNFEGSPRLGTGNRLEVNRTPVGPMNVSL